MTVFYFYISFINYDEIFTEYGNCLKKHLSHMLEFCTSGKEMVMPRYGLTLQEYLGAFKTFSHTMFRRLATHLVSERSPKYLSYIIKREIFSFWIVYLVKVGKHNAYNPMLNWMSCFFSLLYRHSKLKCDLSSQTYIPKQ